MGEILRKHFEPAISNSYGWIPREEIERWLNPPRGKIEEVKIKNEDYKIQTINPEKAYRVSLDVIKWKEEVDPTSEPKKIEFDIFAVRDFLERNSLKDIDEKLITGTEVPAPISPNDRGALPNT